VARVERRLSKLTEQEELLHAQMASQADDYARLAQLQTDLVAVVAERELLEEQWLEAAELAD